MNQAKIQVRKVFNLGFSKTGTTSIEQALQHFGYRVARGHWKYNYCFYLLSLCINDDYDEIIKFTKSFDAFCDGPWGGGTNLYKRLVEEYPDAHFMLSVRDPEKWHKSLVNLLSIFDRNEETALESYAANGMWGSAYWFRNIFDIETLAGNKDKIIRVYTEYNSEVIQYFKTKEIPLLVMDLSTCDPWTELCN